MSARTGSLGIGVIGCGQWGPNHVRVFSELPRSRVVACADTNEARIARIRSRFPQVRVEKNYRALLDDPTVHAIVVATPTATHARITAECLDAGKHVLVEKPAAVAGREIVELGRRAARAGVTVMVGHVFVYNNGIGKLRGFVESGALGQIHYLDAARTNLGPIRGDVNVLFDLATHDVSIFNYLLGAVPVEVSALGRCITQTSIEDVCFATLRYPDGTLGHIHASWLNPRKVRTITVAGQRKMAHWDDVDPEDTLRLYDKGVETPPHYNSFGEFQCLLRSADVLLPKIERIEPLVNQANAFLDTVLDGAPCRSGLKEALEVVAVLEAAQRSMESGGRSCPVHVPSLGVDHDGDETWSPRAAGIRKPVSTKEMAGARSA